MPPYSTTSVAVCVKHGNMGLPTPAPDGRSATLAVRNNDESFRDKGRDSKNTTYKGKSEGSKSKARKANARVVARVP